MKSGLLVWPKRRVSQSQRWPIRQLSAALIAAGLLSSCAGWLSYQEGKNRLRTDEPEAAVAQFRDASRKDPENAQFKTSLISEQGKLLNASLAQADAALERSEFDSAASAYKRALALVPGTDRAQQGLLRVERARTEAAEVAAIEQLLAKGDTAQARSRLLQLRELNAQHPAIARLTRLTNQALGAQAGTELGIYPRLKDSFRRPVSLSLTQAPLQQVFEAMRLATGINFVLDRDVRTDSRVTLAVKDKPAEDVLRLILATQKLERRVLDEDTILVYPNDPAKQREYQEIVTRSFYLSNVEAAKASALLKSVLKVRETYVDDRLNLLVVRDSPEVIRLASRLLATQDLADAEVVLELEVLEVSFNRLLEAGVTWPDSVSASVRGASGNAGQLTVNELRHFTRDLVRLQFNDPALSARLRETAADTNLLANPRIRVRNRQPASILIGEKVPVITTSTTANVGISESVNYLDVGLKLDIEPTVSLDDEVSMKLKLEVSNILDTVTRSSGTVTYRLGTRTASTNLRVKHGQTQVLAGLIQKEDRGGGQGIPYVGRIPLLGKLFSQQRDSEVRTEVILLITPRVVRNLAVPELPDAEILLGTEASVGASPLQLRQAAGSALPAVQLQSPGMPQMPIAPGMPPQGLVPPTPGGPGSAPIPTLPPAPPPPMVPPTPPPAGPTGAPASPTSSGNPQGFGAPSS